MADTAEEQGNDYKLKTKSIILTGFGGYDKLKIEDKPRPTAGKDEVLINIKATSINFAELMARQGLYDMKMKCPAVLGMEGSGVVVELGESVSSLKGTALFFFFF